MSDPIEVRVEQVRAVLTACAAEGYDPGRVSLTLKAGDVGIVLAPRPADATAYRILRSITDERIRRSSLPRDGVVSTVWTAAGVCIYGQERTRG